MAYDPRSILEIVDTYPREYFTELGGVQYVSVTYSEPPAQSSEIDDAWSGRTLPPALRAHWGVSREIALFYSQGSDGVIFYDPKTSREQTSALLRDWWIEDDSFHDDDVVVGDMQGYDHRFLYSPGDGWIIHDSIAPRSEWIRLGETLNRFLAVYRDHHESGEWELLLRRNDMRDN
ncbi:hypothetical protein nbrc107696_19470 [Gordonia spumicola]|uniref:SMI1/KNR4 family protein n=1 Tax=Gordonia spumicola TaxID=589161 RepID=A0A7I9V8Q4_9ACTN|nr:hypothetical protein nbrc107696_19470 [Gordonia spumicola]